MGPYLSRREGWGRQVGRHVNGSLALEVTRSMWHVSIPE